MQCWSHVFLIAAMVAVRIQAQGDIPTDWIDPDTGHRVVRLSREEGDGARNRTSNPPWGDPRLPLADPYASLERYSGKSRNGIK